MHIISLSSKWIEMEIRYLLSSLFIYITHLELKIYLNHSRLHMRLFTEVTMEKNK